MQAMNRLDPKITFKEAMALYENQSALARALELNRQTVSVWRNMKYIPPLHAHRLRVLHPTRFEIKLRRKKVA